MPSIEVSHPETKKVHHKTFESNFSDNEKAGRKTQSSISERFYGILKISDTAVIDEIAERDQFD
jgi:hypothetical protein